jgi:hypothetical protein
MKFALAAGLAGVVAGQTCENVHEYSVRLSTAHATLDLPHAWLYHQCCARALLGTEPMALLAPCSREVTEANPAHGCCW